MTERELAQELVAAIAAQDPARLRACFGPHVQFRALLPPGLRERSGAGETAELIGSWFGDSDPLELLDSTVEKVGDRLHIAYRFQGVEDGQPYLVEQQLYCTLGEEGIESADLLCSGSRPLPAL
jgi:hypothetical protein